MVTCRPSIKPQTWLNEFEVRKLTTKLTAVVAVEDESAALAYYSTISASSCDDIYLGIMTILTIGGRTWSSSLLN